MPNYIFKHPKTGETKEIFQKMNEDHIFIDAKGLKWTRVFSNPFVAFDTEIDPFNPKDFINKTKNKKGTIGDLWDASGEASEKRKKKAGRDEIKQRTIDNYRKKCHGIRHPHE